MPDNATPGTAVATTSSHPLVQFKTYVEIRAAELVAALPQHISAEKFQRTLMTAVQENPDLLDVERRSLWLACLKAAHDGLLPDKKEAVILPFKENKKVDGQWQTRWVAVYIPMVYGLRKKILQSGEVIDLQPGVVYRKEVEAGHFYYEVGKFPPLGHRPLLDLTAEDTTDDKIVGAYSIATLKDGTKSYEFMRRFEIDKVRETSQTGATRKKSGEPRTPSGPWVEWFPEQCKKTAIRRHSKVLPSSTDIIVEKTDVDIEVAARVATMLSHTHEDEPVLITDETPHDPETGEVIEDDANVTGDDTSEEPVKETPKSEPEKATRGKAKADKDPNPPGPPADEQQHPTGQDEGEPTRDPAEPTAERLLGEFAKAKSEDELDKLWNGSELERAGMWDETHEVVLNGFNRNLKRVRQPEPAK